MMAKKSRPLAIVGLVFALAQAHTGFAASPLAPHLLDHGQNATRHHYLIE